MQKNNGERVRDVDGFRLRAAGICVRIGKGSCKEVLLVSAAKDENSWVIPGGGIERNENAEAAVLREVMEEAGIRARIVSKIGDFKDEERRHRTAVFLLDVIEEMLEWDDGCYGRKRQWFTFDEGLIRIKRSQLYIIQHLANAHHF